MIYTGNVKRHKPNSPLRPIISRITIPSYGFAKQLCNIIIPFIPKKYSLKSSDSFIDISHSKQPQGILAPLDMESLFSHVPILPTIEIILNNVYRHLELHPPKIPEEMMKHLLLAYTNKAPFRSPSGQLYLQVEGVAMGSPLGCTFAEFYMRNLEKSYKTPS
ncbi:uncharacterized protein LOC143027357 [Oratosquilla oratoria]|uniref:uncharacterized protein LOC143027357 n=1 Tax=Oratosquilla oratoria TaxID=337810 RepID=UPI003F76E9AD